jgi:purine-binding chemotaxis protein CheW
VLDQQDTMHALTFLLDGTLYALRLDTVERVVHAAALTPLPGAPAIVLGLIDLEGRIVPVVHIRARFRLPEREMGIDDCIIIATTGRRTLGILVDAPGEVMEVAEADIERGTGVLMGSDYIEGVVRLDIGLVLIHDLESFLSLEEEKSIAGAMAEMGGKR